MIILSINKHHNASATLMIDDEIIFHIESERLSRIKRDDFPFYAMEKTKDYVSYIDILVISGMSPTSRFDNYRNLDAYSAYVISMGKSFRNHDFQIYDLCDRHHEVHAFTSFYNSGFDSALSIVKDGSGSTFKIENLDYCAREISSAFIISYPKNIELIDKHLSLITNKNIDPFMLNDKVMVSSSISEGAAYEATCTRFGLNSLDAGKLMGMAAYGNQTHKYQIYKNGVINTELFTHEDFGDSFYYPTLNIDLDNDFQSRANFAKSLQSSVEKAVVEYILSLSEKTDKKNICLSGGFFLNCSTNYKIRKSLDKNINLYVEPVSGDAGNSIGAAKMIRYMLTNSLEKHPIKSLYLGPKIQLNIDEIKEEYVYASPNDVAKLISDKKIVAIFQSRSEAGPRALGNRSILYDPRDPDGKEKVNIVKKREWYRPFAGSVLAEFSSEWFDLSGMKESKYMMYSVDVLKNKQKEIPSIVHVDGTCRVQTVSIDDNKNYYELIKELYKITGIPIIFNTSFNLAGEPLVESLDDAILTFKNSEIDYLYLPELKILIRKE